jgi:electron transport complex protein RnfB
VDGEKPQMVAFIREDECIGCTKCIQACPVDAIVGAARLMHTVLADRCTGCELCIPPCPVDCISLAPAPGLPAEVPEGATSAARAGHYRALYEARLARLARNARRREARLAARLAGVTAATRDARQ